MNIERINTVPEGRFLRAQTRNQSPCPELWTLLDEVKDPEIPALSIWDMGILQNVQIEYGQLLVVITPTYSGCPAMDLIKEDIQRVLADAGHANVKVVTRLSPAWTTEWMTEDAKRRMRESGIASPTDIVGESAHCGVCHVHDLEVLCPRCQSGDTRVVSEFGSTACKALMQCNQCSETFDYFKQI